jgi:putative spermidine/putrescine transport system ATP-binding protein
MHELLAQVREKLNPTVLMVTHDRDEASAVADQLALMADGKLLQHSSVEAMYTRPASLLVSRLMGGSNEVPGTVRGGIHYSALGAHPLPGNQQWPEGAATLLIREERIVLLDEHSRGLPAMVTRVRARGPRKLVTVETAGLTLQADSTPYGHLAVGDSIRLHFPASALAAVALGQKADDPDRTLPNAKVLT